MKMTDEQMLSTFRADNGLGIGDAEQAIACLIERAEYLTGRLVTLRLRPGDCMLLDPRHLSVATGKDFESLARDLFERFPEVEQEIAS